LFATFVRNLCSQQQPVTEFNAMKTLIMLGSLITALLLSQTAAADHRDYRRGYDHYRNYDYYRSYRDSYRYSNYFGVNPYHFGNRRGSSFHFSYGDRYSRRHDHDAGYFVGGLVLGSLLSAPRYYARYNANYYERPVERVVYRSAPVVTQREVVVVRNIVRNEARNEIRNAARTTSAANNQIASGRRLLRDLEGNCFERNVDEEGNEIRVQLQSQECNF